MAPVVPTLSGRRPGADAESVTALREARTDVVPAGERPRLFQLVSWLLTYPDDALVLAQADLSIMAAGLEHRGVQQRVLEFLDWFAATAGPTVQQHYVETFDPRGECGLYLTYYLHGDPRTRGIAVATLKRRYRAQGRRLTDGERPDPLPAALESAAADGATGETPQRHNRHGVELLRRSLDATGSPYRHLLEAVTLALPDLNADDHSTIAGLARGRRS